MSEPTPATEADEQWIRDTYGKTSDELADEAEKGYPVESMKRAQR